MMPAGSTKDREREEMEASLAVLVTGEVRGGQPLLSDAGRLAPPKARTFFSVWNKVGRKLDGWIGPWQLWRVLGKDVANSVPQSLIGTGVLERFLPGFFDALRAEVGQRTVDRAAMDAISPYVDIEDQALFVEILPPESRGCNARLIHYKLARALAMMRLAEEAAGTEFKNVMRIRPDAKALPDYQDDFAADEFYTDWKRSDPSEGSLLIGDNAILARREVIVGLCEYLRHLIYDQIRGNIHDLLGEFVTRYGLKPRVMDTHLADDVWPLDLFIQHLGEKLSADPSDPEAREFLACVKINTCLTRGDVGGAAAQFAGLEGSESIPALLCRGRLALATGQMAELSAILSEFATYSPSTMKEHLYYQWGFSALKAQRAKEESLEAIGPR